MILNYLKKIEKLLRETKWKTHYRNNTF
jgi:hypothetical protein